ncbi:BAG domain-containing protein [Verticillium dahliae VdLs.17]|uniref:BAG domain-containing protein n=1 Tax=Verticillium dahliae (strain VdLs.17 / ATCC MYA-4575 / FGSC 10137) TaxID=498257 RepID=G2XB65_VERDV|nr:BAG domain-containing protein [Verticillium dahliae VdLs.17]EGY16039.1 BAG domain-containing protein [Verticillium dahliae VdLs.17]KAH6686997.1 BAG domain-containing protein [Verticillium dahliae]
MPALGYANDTVPDSLTLLEEPPPPVYLDKSLTRLAETITISSGFVAEKLGVDPHIVLYTTIGCILLAVPFSMSRYGWPINRESLSPYGSSLGGVPNITDDDFSYITSEDLHEPAGGSRYQPRTHNAVPPAPEDDILLFKNKGVTYPVHFPAYTIGDGKLRVCDIRDRIAVELDLSDRRARRAKILYKGRQLKEPAAPVRDYGVKNNSEVMVVLPDIAPGEESGSTSDEEMVVVADDRGSAGGVGDDKKRRKKKSKKSKKSKTEGSPRDSASTFSLPGRDSDTPSSPRPATATGPGPIAALNELDNHFMTTLYPLCQDFMANTPTDPKKLEDEHRKISETVMMQVILKLDAVETNGDPDARARRKELVQKVQNVLKDLDTRLKK